MTINSLESLIKVRISRRNAIKALGKAGALAALGSIFPGRVLYGLDSEIRNENLFFKPLQPSGKDELVLPDGFEYTILRQWGDKINDAQDYGYNNDYVSYLPIDLRSGGTSNIDGLLVVNHEYPNPLYVSGYTYEDLKAGKNKTPEQVQAEKKSMGVSIFRIKQINGKWQFINDELNRRYDGNSRILLSGYAAGSKEMRGFYECKGTVENCSGGITPWNTLLSAEENFQDITDPESLRWSQTESDIIEEHYGWLVEIDPFDKNYIPKKRTSMGRFRHENVAIVQASNGRLACYMGDDKANECVYKFITDDVFDPEFPDPDILDKGRLYAADFTSGRWKLLDYSSSEALQKHFSSQAGVLVNCDTASKLVGGTECNRPEDIEIHPLDKSIYIAFTNNYLKDDLHGSIVRITEYDNDHTSDKFNWEVFAAGGVDEGFSSPDNMHFDSKGNLWILSDISPSSINSVTHKPFKNNSLFMMPTSGPDRGKAFRFASGPVDSEMCGISFTPDEKTMFLSVQHPGERTTDINHPTSRWPHFGNDIPRPAVVAITGFK